LKSSKTRQWAGGIPSPNKGDWSKKITAIAMMQIGLDVLGSIFI
jgi:hypothetical protein